MRVLAYDPDSGRALWLSREISFDGLLCTMQLGSACIYRTLAGPDVDAAYHAFEARDARAFDELLYPTQPSTQAAPVRRSPEDVAA